MDEAGLLKDLKKQVTALEDDLRERSESVEEFRTRLEAEYARARKGQRTAAMYGPWRDDRVTQAAAAWVLACVFVRFCEDNGLIQWPYLSGPEERLRDAEERHEAFFREKPHLNNRDWLVEAFEHLAGTNETVAGLFDHRHNPLWELTPSYEAATELLNFWRRRGADGEILYDFTDGEWDTRFLGDLYQDLSEHARKKYALLQTPEFVEEFILDLTLEPAIEECGLSPEGGLRTIDPACGSGHFLLGIFARLVEKWRAAEPGTDEWAVVRRALESVHGCDKNPFAVSIARFRLLVAAMRAAGTRRLAEAPTFPINVAVGDSLLHGRGAAGIQGELDLFAQDDGQAEAFQYATEDVGEFAACVDLLGRGSYHVVVGNPPYITVKDERENENYRLAYDACIRQYALSVPFAQRLFELADRGKGGVAGGGGFIGQITSNSFMKREFGKKLIEEFLAQRVDLSHVIDTSGAYIPGHGTPTVILVGRNRTVKAASPIRAVLGIRGEPSQPKNAREGVVWNAIVNQVARAGSDSDWVSVDDVKRVRFSGHPWSLSGGGSGELFARLNESGNACLSARVSEIGFGAVTREDSAYMAGSGALRRAGIESKYRRPLVEGDVTRDFSISDPVVSAWPYSEQSLEAETSPSVHRFLWPNRTILRERVAYGNTQLDRGLKWYEYSMFFEKRYRVPLSIPFAFVATHNHFVLDRGGKVFKQSVPVIKLPKGAGDDKHLELLGVLNSSTACFWLKQVSQAKAGGGTGRGMQDEAWEERYEFTGTRLQDFPLPDLLPLALGRELDSLAQQLAGREPATVSVEGVPTRAALDSARAEHISTHHRMIFFQEELDWQVYGSYGLLTEAETARVTGPLSAFTNALEVALGERSFEILLARKVARGEAETAWFDRHGSTSTTEIPAHWPEWYREVAQSRIDIIASRKDIGLIERPECKRRWASESWEKKERAALRAWLLNHAEDPDLWYGLRDGMKQPRTLTASQLADALRDDDDFNSVAQLYAADHLGKPDLPLADVLAEIVAAEHVPYLAAMRYKDSGLRNHEQWEQVWDMQRAEDRTERRLDIAVPPKYKSADFQKMSFWFQRGKLDVPKERFISYPEASPDADPTILLGWAGWDHKDQAQALFNLVDDRTKQAAWDTERIKPLLAGLLEVLPWVRQWHGEYDAEWEAVPADEFEAYFEELCGKHQVSEQDLRAWRPEKKTRGRKAAAPKKRAADEQPAPADE